MGASPQERKGGPKGELPFDRPIACNTRFQSSGVGAGKSGDRRHVIAVTFESHSAAEIVAKCVNGLI
jgi:hypothetical protein